MGSPSLIQLIQLKWCFRYIHLSYSYSSWNRQPGSRLRPISMYSIEPVANTDKNPSLRICINKSNGLERRRSEDYAAISGENPYYQLAEIGAGEQRRVPIGSFNQLP